MDPIVCILKTLQPKIGSLVLGRARGLAEMDFDGSEIELVQGGSEQPYRRLLRRARRAFSGQDYETARRILEALARTAPDSTSQMRQTKF